MVRERYIIDTESRTFEGVPVRKIPWPKKQPSGIAIMEKIFLRAALWEDFLTGNPGPETISMLVHEDVHIKRWRKNIKLHIKFWFRRDHRFQEELFAIEDEMGVLKQHGVGFDIDRRARDLSAPYS